MRLIRILHSALAYFLVFVLICVAFIPGLILLLLPQQWRMTSKIYFGFEYIFCWLAMKATLLPIKFKGLENIPKRPAIVIANHQSALDIPLISLALGRFPHMWLALNTLLTWSPILRFMLPRIAILVDTSSPIAGMKTLLRAIKLANRGKKIHLVIFPEGGRFTDGKIHDFYSGFITLAQKTNRPVVPILIQGAYKVYPPGTWLLEYHEITVTVGPTFVLEANETSDVFNARVRDWYLKTNAESQK